MPNELSWTKSVQLASAAAEPVRLVVWDLDETFWRGTLTEGGITEYVQAHHDIIITLARRGIMSSVCSKNNADDVLPILRAHGILDYIIFPSISWDGKGMRLVALIEAVQLRPASVMFIDDNPNNLGEARALVPDIQVADETFIPRMLEDPRFAGKADTTLTRLAQYKLLETRKRDEAQASGGNIEFLRGCDIRVHVEHDVVAHLDRAIELINRTNQLNYTKRRLPEETAKARAALTELCRSAKHQVGLIRVTDKYGDYGFVGFFMLRNRRSDPIASLANQTLIHYCFSCRTLGMFVEQWFYEYLRRPQLTVVGEVLTDLSAERDIDWIRLGGFTNDDGSIDPMSKPAMRVLGGCEANAVGHFLGAHASSVQVTGNFAAGVLFVRVNSASLLLSACDNAGQAFADELALLGIARPLLGVNYFEDADPGTVFVFSGAFDGSPIWQYRFRHRIHGWEIKVGFNQSPINFVTASESEINEIADRKLPDDEKQQMFLIARHIRNNYDSVLAPSGPALTAVMQRLLARVPRGCKLIILLDDERTRKASGAVVHSQKMEKYNIQMRALAQRFPFVEALAIGGCIQHENEIQVGGNHYDRAVYWRLSEKIVETAAHLPGKLAPQWRPASATPQDRG